MMVLRAGRLDVIGKRVFEIGEKFYFEDLGLRHALVGFRLTDIDKILENLLFIHLKAAGYDVRVGYVGDREVDFVCDKDGERLYVQTTYRITDEKVRDREFGTLLSIRDNFPKVVVSMDELAGASYEGIEHIPVQEFLLGITQPERGTLNEVFTQRRQR
jgi:predicted AAA+ superfamily ATPase